MRSETTHRKMGYSIVAAIIFSLWWGVPTYRKWKADRVVDELCAKDGGSKIYEIIILPENKFNKLGMVYVRPKEYVQPSDEYYETNKITWIIPENDSFGGLDLFRSNSQIFRIKDGKLLSEHVSYIRRGGDPVGPWHPSSYTCSNKSAAYKQPFKHKQDGGIK